MPIVLKEKVNVTKSFIPPLDEYIYYVKQIYNNGLLTNQGPLLKKLENQICEKLNLNNFHFVTNGTIALQLALKALDICDGEIITTPFSYVATVSAILWERCKPVFVDIEPANFTIDIAKIEEKITSKTKAILPVHIFGYACDVKGIQKIADRYNLKVIYDAAHCFGSSIGGGAMSLLNFGDVSTCSFHATKLFHTIEGGGCIVKDKSISDKLELIKRFGHNGDKHYCLGINAKQSEFHAAMGLSNLPYVEEIIKERKRVCDLYDELLGHLVQRPEKQKELNYNYAYYPVIFKDEVQLLRVLEILNKNNIFPRRYFYPSLNKLPYLDEYQPCPVSEDICSRIACLPLYSDLKSEKVVEIAKLIKEVL